ncbi:MAG: YraN family protein [Deltaproteobacteria bacterium]|nr:YraN family protein [Deltaproteobacteria bacterium]
MKSSGRMQTGKKGEEIAARYLESRGYRIIERNYRSRWGEIDIVAKDGNTVVFVEVKCRRSESFGDPQSAVGTNKQRKVSRMSLAYLKEKGLYPCDARFDVVAVKMLPAGNRVELIRNAFEIAL